MDYDLEISRVIAAIKKEKAGLVCLQLPEGIKPQAMKLADEIESKTEARCIIWLGSCYGACDIPDVEKLGVDILIQFGHAAWPYKNMKVLK